MSNNNAESEPQFGTPAAEWHIDEELVRRLLESQQPDLAGEEIRLVDEGWDNVMYRLGDELMIRMPRRALIVPSIVAEQEWLPELATRLSIPVPAPIRCGRPEECYPWPWSIVPYLDGQTADLGYPDSSEAQRFVTFLRELHQPSDAELPPGNSRGRPLSDRADFVAERMSRIADTGLVTPALRRMWQRGMDAPLWEDERWIHGDLHGRNVLVKDGVLTGIIDWGDVFIGDVAIDLAGIWMLFEDKAAWDTCLALYGPDDATLTRALGWAVFYGVLLLDSGRVDNPAHARMGHDLLLRLHIEAAAARA